jgi:hypothetical protein
MSESSGETALDALVTSYIDYLLVKSPSNELPFRKRLATDPEAAQAEASVFQFLRQAGLNPHPDEDPTLGGVDFICHPKDAASLHVEVTSISIETVTKHSGLTHPIVAGAAPSFFSTITSQLLNEAINKAPQLQGKPGARVLAICSQHSWANVLCGTRAAVDLLAGDSKIRVPIGDEAKASYMALDLKNSAFFRFDKDHIAVEPARQSISAILLIALQPSTRAVVGLLHPAPAVPFDPNLLPKVPFAKVKNWPLGAKLEGEWVNLVPRPDTSYQLPIKLSDAELKGL